MKRRLQAEVMTR